MKIRKAFLCAALLAVMLFAAALPVAAESKDCGAKLIAITFDDGPGPYTSTLLDGLAARNVKATFFVAGYQAVNYPDLLKRIVNEGHQLANHTYNHKNLNTLSSYGIQQEIASTRKLLMAAGGNQTYYIRPPYGNANNNLKANANAPIITWSVDPLDWKYRNADTVCQNIVNASYDGAIILVHDIYSSSVNGALAAIDKLQAAGYEFVTVHDLLLRRGVTPENGKIYNSAKNYGINLTAEQINEEYYDENRLTEHWGYDAMSECIEKGILSVSEDGKWRPNGFVTRGEFVTALAKACGITQEYPTNNAFYYSDISDNSPLFPYVTWATNKGIVNGSNGKFLADDVLTREQMATIIARYLSYSLNVQMPSKYDLSEFSDNASISKWAASGVALCVQRGILKGGSNGRFMPLGKLTRAQVSTLLVRLSNL